MHRKGCSRHSESGSFSPVLTLRQLTKLTDIPISIRVDDTLHASVRPGSQDCEPNNDDDEVEHSLERSTDALEPTATMDFEIGEAPEDEAIPRVEQRRDYNGHSLVSLKIREVANSETRT